MAEGGQAWLEEEDGDQTDEFLMLPFMAPFLAQLKKEGDKRFRAQDYREAAAFYEMALNCPIPFFLKVSVIFEQIFRRRAVCLYKMGNYHEAIEDSDRAIDMAGDINSRHIVQPIFIKMKAIQCLGDHVPALKLAVLCKHLRPECEEIKTALNELKEKLRNELKKHDTLIDEVLNTMVGFAKQMQKGRNTLGLALECYTELLDLLDVMFSHIPGVLLSRAECFLKLERYDEAKDDCMKALWMMPGHEKAIELMHQITQSLKEAEKRKTKKTEKRNMAQVEKRAAEVGTKQLTTEGQEQKPVVFEMQRTQEKQGNLVFAAVNVLEEVKEAEQVQDMTAKDLARIERKKKRNKQKKARKKEKEKEAQLNKKDVSANLKAISNTDTSSPDASDDENESQEMDNVIREADISLAYGTNTDRNAFALEEVSSWKVVSYQRPTRNSSSASSVKKSLPHSQSFERDASKRRPSAKQVSTAASEGMLNNLKGSSTSGSVQAWFTEPVHPARISAPSSISQSFQGNVVARVLQADKPVEVRDNRVIPEGVCVVCDHFLQAYPNRPTNISMKNKTCELCKNINKLKYAVWNKRGYWQEMRPYPASKVPAKVTLDVCRHFTTYRSCPKTTCTFPHGKVELAMWILERKGVLPTPQESLAAATAATAINATASTKGLHTSSTAAPSMECPSGQNEDALQAANTRRESREALTTNFAASSVDEFPRLGTPSLLRPTADATENVTSSVWTSGTDAFKRSLNQVLPSTKPTILPSKMAEARVVSPQKSTAFNKRPEMSGRPTTPVLTLGEPLNMGFQVEDAGATSYQRFTTDSLKNTTSSNDTAIPISEARQSGSVSNTKISTAPLPNTFRIIPDGVFVVCDDFLQKNFKRAASIYEKNKPCKGCENRSKLKYAIWSDINKQWQIIRPYPAEKVPLNVAFSQCRQYSFNTLCLRTPCSFAHGEQELQMWTLEREGVLPTPRETLTGSPGKSSEISTNTQPSTQLRYRPSPPGVPNGAFKLCRSCYTRERCRFGRGCIFAHGKEELKEWQQEYLRKEREKLRKELQDKDEIVSVQMATQILKGPAEDLVEFLPGVEVTCSPPQLSVKLQDSNDTHACQWTFTLTFQTSDVGHLRHVLLLHRYHNCYQLSDIRVDCERYNTCYTAKLKDFWYKAPDVNNLSGRVTVYLTVAFESSLYGSFDQCVVFDFGKKPYLIQKLNADVQSESLSNAPIVSQHLAASAIWDERSMEVVRFVHKTGEALQGEHLSRMYSLPKQVEITADELSRDNYKNVMHQLLFMEEGFMKYEISRYTLNNTQLHAQWNIFDEMTGMKCTVDGELFGVLYLHEEDALRPDDAAGRLLYRNVSSVWLQLADSVSNKVYEAPVEKVESECVVLRLSSKMCSDLHLYDTCDVSVNAQFQLNRWPLCKMHSAIDRLTTGQLRFIFPKPRVCIRSEVTIRWQWLLDQRLNENQKTVIKRIASAEYNAPPLVVFGPFGTGKTFTLNQAVRLLVQVDNRHRILLCTHSNRAADIHVELLHKYLTEQNGIPAARPLRIYQPMRRLETASKIARNYSLIKNDVFVLPSRDDLVEHRVVVTTLSTSQVFLDLQVLHGFFTHILIDEAAQALEPEALTPLIFAGPNTKVVFTGDHMQMSPEVYSPQARCLGLQKSLAERLFDMYDKNESEEMKESNVVFLTENYRCHQDILQFPSDNFYGEKLVARGHASQLAHPKYGPLLFFSARGKEQKEHDNSYINLSEVYEVVKRVKEVAQSWPARCWGPKKLSEIAVLSSYRYQVQAIRNGLRKDRDLKDVKVDTIHNVRGEEFRALFISTVRTFHTCKPQREEVSAGGSDRQLYWEFLSDPKLLNTAVTRAKCLIAVVGDPVSLCTVGECRSIWRDYIKRCDDRGGLYGTTMAELDKEINAAIASIELNPKAQPFVPISLSAPEQNADVTEENTAKSNEEALDETRGGKNDGKVQPLEIKEGEPTIPQERSAKVMENHQDVKDVSSIGTAVDSNLEQNQEYKEEEEVEVDEEETKDGIVESGDLQDDLLEDETVSPRYMDEIILAFVKKCEETLQLNAARNAMFDNSEFPPLQASGSKEFKLQPVEKEHHMSFKSGADIKDLFPEIRVINGRVEVRLTNLGFYKSPSERAQQIMASSKQQEFLDPSVLRQLLRDDPKKYVVCNLRISPDNFQVGYAAIEDTETPDIQIKGRVRQAFDKDKVVVELAEQKARSKTDGTELQVQGKVVGVLEHIISPHERQFVCTTDYENPVLMVPINKSATKLVNLSDKSCKDIPMYKKDQNGRATQVKMIKREKVLSGKYLFVVKYLQWRREFCHPLGIVVRAMRIGEDLKSSMEIAFAERGIRKVFKEDTTKYVKEKFPPQWSIPENEYANRSKIDKVVTIDPPTSLDLDDALTIERTSPSTFVVGIHIADVSFFVKPNSPLDHEAFLRCTSYYPGKEQENVPMLPRELSESHCSLLPDQDRLAVSVFVTLDNEGRITEGPKIQRTIVRSCCRLSYAEAQIIIEKRNIGTIQVPEEIAERIRQLSCLAQKRRLHRLEDRAFDHWQNQGIEEHVEAHELVEEMMILANEEIAKLLSETCSELAPLRVQLPPKDHRLAEWIEMHGKYARLSLQFSRMFQNSTSDETSPLNILHSDKTMFKIQRWVWGEICQAAESCDLPRLHYLICNERNHPQIAAAQSHFRRIQSGARYVCEGDQPSANIQHYSLGIRSYTHFTSPIRRYIDVAVHRLLLALQSGSSYEESMFKDDITKVCRRSTFMQDNARKFDKDCKRIHMATKLQQRCHETRVFIESIEPKSISLHICKPEDDQLAGRQKRMLFSHMNPVALKEEDKGNDREKCIVLKWKIRKYVAPDAPRNLKEDDDEAKKLAGYSGTGEVAEIPSDIWIRILDAVRANEESKLTTIIKQTEASLGIKYPSHTEEKLPQLKSPDCTRGIPYKHPHYDENTPPSSSETVCHFYEKSLALRKYDYFSVQLCPRMMRGILEPDIQMVKVNSHLNICIEHRRYPRESFAHTARHQASRERYGTIDEYIRAWKPVLAMEAATEAVKENDGFIIEHLNLKWEKDDGTVTALFSLPSIYCTGRQLDFHLGDLACIRVAYSDTDSPYGETSAQEQISLGNSVENRRVSDFWVGHCIIKEVNREKGKKTIEVKMDLHQTASNIPEELRNGIRHRCTLELIHRTLPQRRMYAALCSNLEDSSELVHAICKGEEPTEEHFDTPPSNMSLVQYGFKTLNQYQEAAVKEALSKPFTLIQGPPGTGKTVTGVHIAYWFAERNKRLKSYKVWENETGDNKVEGAYKAPPQVIYCGPSNKAVDVVTEYLMKIPDLKVLRVYSDQIEQKEFPIPNKLKPARITRSDDELKISSEKIRCVSLHHVIRRFGCPFEEELRQFEEGFAEHKARGEIISQNDVGDYCKVIGQAEQWALEKSGAQIILCTCAASGSPRITSSCDNIQQCIVDECGMCLEPESLVPITCSGARQVVLIGDHKQLQPVIQDHVAKTLGLSVSMFERHSKRAMMLAVQYRMHKGICEFPSKQFYDGKLQTADVVNSRDPSPVCFWPAQVRRNRNLPIVFCHVEGQEESSAITTSESNEESKRNMKEVRKVVQVAKYLINRYRPRVRMSDVVILSPYREQRSKISELLKGVYEDIQVTTVTKSQGSEWDYVIISLVRSLKKEDIDPEPSLSWLREHLGFLTDEHQMNVGLTRARRGLCIIGNKNLLGMDEMWKKLLEHYEENHSVVDESWPWP